MSARTAIRDAGTLIARLEPFTSHGALRGDNPDRYPPAPGRLPTELNSELMTAFYDGRLDFIVYSYATPIAWHRTDTGWTIPDVRYSATTSRHQGVVRRVVA